MQDAADQDGPTPGGAGSTDLNRADSRRADGASMVRESGKLSLLTMVSRVLGLLRETTRADLLGTTRLAEAFSVAFNTPNLFRRLIAEGAMSTAFIPTMKTYFTEGDDARTRRFLSATLTMFTLAVALIVAAGVAGAYWITRANVALGLDSSLLDVAETTYLLRLMFPFLALVAFAAFFQGILNAHGIFTPSGYGPILFNICFLVVPYFLRSFFPNPARAMAIGVLVGGLAQAVCQLPFVLRLGLRFGFMSPAKALADPGMKRVLALLAPTIVGTAAYEINGFLSTGLASGVGAATALQYSLRLQELILGVFIVSISTVLLPQLSGLAAENAWDDFVERFKRSFEAILLVTVPIMVFSIIERVDIVTLLFKRGLFGDDSVALTASAFLFHSLGLVFIAANRIINPVFYARKDSKSPTWAGLASLGVNMLAAWLLSLFMRGPGIALALSIASAVNFAILVAVLLRQRQRLPGMRKALLDAGLYALRLLAYSAAAAIPVMLLRRPFYQAFGGLSSPLLAVGLPFALSGLVFGGIGLGLLAVTRDPVARFLLSSLSRKKRRS